MWSRGLSTTSIPCSKSNGHRHDVQEEQQCPHSGWTSPIREGAMRMGQTPLPNQVMRQQPATDTTPELEGPQEQREQPASLDLGRATLSPTRGGVATGSQQKIGSTWSPQPLGKLRQRCANHKGTRHAESCPKGHCTPPQPSNAEMRISGSWRLVLPNLTGPNGARGGGLGSYGGVYGERGAAMMLRRGTP